MKTLRLEVRITSAQRMQYDKARGRLPLAIWVRDALEREIKRAKHSPACNRSLAICNCDGVVVDGTMEDREDDTL